ncbi:hypothetical protein D3C72_1369470 [compost metagenome]
MRFNGDEGLGIAVVVDIFLEVIRRNFLAADFAGAVLAAHRLVLHILAGNGFERPENFHLLVAHRFCFELRGRFHGYQAEELEQVVL